MFKKTEAAKSIDRLEKELEKLRQQEGKFVAQHAKNLEKERAPLNDKEEVKKQKAHETEMTRVRSQFEGKTNDLRKKMVTLEDQASKQVAKLNEDGARTTAESVAQIAKIEEYWNKELTVLWNTAKVAVDSLEKQIGQVDTEKQKAVQTLFDGLDKIATEKEESLRVVKERRAEACSQRKQELQEVRQCRDEKIEEINAEFAEKEQQMNDDERGKEEAHNQAVAGFKQELASIDSQRQSLLSELQSLSGLRAGVNIVIDTTHNNLDVLRDQKRKQQEKKDNTSGAWWISIDFGPFGSIGAGFGGS